MGVAAKKNHAGFSYSEATSFEEMCMAMAAECTNGHPELAREIELEQFKRKDKEILYKYTDRLYDLAADNYST